VSSLYPKPVVQAVILTPPNRHLNQVSFSADGNFHANHYPKSSVIKRISLSNGRAYIAETKAYRVYTVKQTVKAVSDANKEVSERTAFARSLI
jgi:hypothetical protein